MNDRFSHIINSSKPVVVDFYTEWCGPCKQMPPILDEVKKTFKAKVRVIKVNVDRHPFIATRYKVRHVPTLMVFKKGRPQWRTEGICQPDELKSVVSGQINS